MQLSTIEHFKALEQGCEILAYRADSRFQRNKGRETVIFIVEKVKRKYVELRRKSSPAWVDSFLPESGITQEDANSGYACRGGFAFFSCLASLDAYKEQLEIADRLARVLNSGLGNSPLKAVTLEDLKVIDRVLSKYMNTKR